MARRLRPLENPVDVWHDGARLQAERGEPLVCSLLAENRVPVARSPKLHRPRGPYCLRGACDGCLARVDGMPNVMTCLVPALGGERIETQNVLGTRELDLLAASDFLFPHGLDHHRLFAGVRGVSSLVSALARRAAGLGKLPDGPVPPRAALEREVDVLVVGGGAAGLSAARVLGRRALVVDDQLELGGSLSTLRPGHAAALLAGAAAAGAELRALTTACALSREPDDGSGRWTALLSGPSGMTHARCRSVLLATGAHDPVPLFENNDLPGLYSARAALRLWRRGVAVGRRVALVGEGRFSVCFAELAQGSLSVERCAPESVVRAMGRARVTALSIRDGKRERRLAIDAVVIDGEGAPSFELAVQAGATTRFEPARGYVPIGDERGLVAPNVVCAGSCRAAPDSAADGERAALAL
jgi:sarcosine oxidase subunit alpha